MTKKIRDKTEPSRRRKSITYSYQRNLGLGIGMIFFTLFWLVAVAPIINEPGATKIFGYVLLAVVSIFNWAMVMGAFRLVPWAPKEVELNRTGVIFRSVGGRDRSVMESVTRTRMKTSPIFLFSRGLVISGKNPRGQLIRESVFFGDLGKEKVYELAEELKRYQG